MWFPFIYFWLLLLLLSSCWIRFGSSGRYLTRILIENQNLELWILKWIQFLFFFALCWCRCEREIWNWCQHRLNRIKSMRSPEAFCFIQYIKCILYRYFVFIHVCFGLMRWRPWEWLKPTRSMFSLFGTRTSNTHTHKHKNESIIFACFYLVFIEFISSCHGIRV